MGALIGLFLGNGYFRNTPITEDVSGSLSILLNCQTVINSASTFFVGILTGFSLWLIYQVASIEKKNEPNNDSAILRNEPMVFDNDCDICCCHLSRRVRVL